MPAERDLEQGDLWGVEVKARVNPGTAGDEEDFTSSSREKNVRICSEQVHCMLRNVGERFQVLHHAYVYDLSTVLFVVGDSQAEIIQSTIIDFDKDLLENYGKVLWQMKDLALGWLYKDNVTLPLKVPQEILEVGRTLPQIHDDEAIEGSVNLWLSLNAQELPLPPILRLIPGICAYWNAVKSGSDTTTKLMDDRALYPPHVNCETIATTRLLLLAVVLIHQCNQIINAQKDLPYPSLAHYRNAASHRTTFHNTLLSINSVLKKEKEKKDQEVSANNTCTPLRSNNGGRRQLPLRQLTHGIVPQPLDYGTNLPFLTPAKIGTKVAKKQVSDSVCEMYENCTGRLLQLVDSKKKRRCTHCKNKTTTYYCAGCKGWFCFTKRVTTANINDRIDKLDLVHIKIKGEQEVFFSTCYAQKHKAAWQEQDAKVSAGITPVKTNNGTN